MKVLVVDDNNMVREMVMTIVAAGGHEPIPAANVAEATPLLGTVDFVVSDVQMPGESGLVLAERAHALGLPVVLTSGTYPQQVPDYVNFMIKPIRPGDLIMVL